MTAYTLYPLVGHPRQSSSSHDCLYLIPLGGTSRTVIQQSRLPIPYTPWWDIQDSHPAVMTAYTLYPLVGHPGQSSSSHDCLYLIPLGGTSRTVIQQSRLPIPYTPWWDIQDSHPAVMTAYTLYPLVGHPGQSSSSHDCLYLIPLGGTSRTVIQQS